MRIVAGSRRGRRLRTPPPVAKGLPEPIRPTADRAREAIFSILGPSRVRQARVLDLFAGSGALGLEALSRGAAEAVFVELYPPALALIEANVSRCGFAGCSLILARDLRQGLSFLPPRPSFDLVFLDPPYGRGLAAPVLAELARLRLLTTAGVAVVEEEAGSPPPDAGAGLLLYEQRRYGAAVFRFYRQGDGDDV